jgi:hypothetical protein
VCEALRVPTDRTDQSAALVLLPSNEVLLNLNVYLMEPSLCAVAFLTVRPQRKNNEFPFACGQRSIRSKQSDLLRHHSREEIQLSTKVSLWSCPTHNRDPATIS